MMYATTQIYVKPDKRSLENFIQKIQMEMEMWFLNTLA